MTAIHRLTRLDPHRRRVLVALAVAIVLVAVSFPLGLRALRGDLPASTGGSVDSGVSRDAGGFTVSPGAPSVSDGAKQEGSDSSGQSAGAGSGAAPGAGLAPVVIGAKVARSAWLGIKVSDLVVGAAKARTIALAAGGQVLSENVVTAADPTGDYGAKTGTMTGDRAVPSVGINEARLTLSVPTDKVDRVLTELSAVGSVSYRSSSSEDVTDTYIDTQARIQPARDSIDRVRALLAKATSLEQIILLESELSRRQADLESLQQRLAELDKRTTMADVSVTMWTDATTPVEPADNAFVNGMKSAWNALLDSVMIVVTGFAVLLPWLLIGLVVAWFVRRALRRRPAPAPTSPAPPAD